MGMKCIGVDVGGTSVKIGLFEITGELLDKWEVRTRKEEGGRYILPDVARSIRDKMEEMGLSLKTDLAGIGLGVRAGYAGWIRGGMCEPGVAPDESPGGAQQSAGRSHCKERK